jgi:hypothetical protein
MLMKEAEEVDELDSLVSRARPTMNTNGFSRLCLLPEVRQDSTWAKTSAA